MSDGVTRITVAKGDPIRTTRAIRFKKDLRTIECPAETPGIVTSVGEGGWPIFVKVAGHEVEVAQNEVTRV